MGGRILPFSTLSPYAHLILEDADRESFLAACCAPDEGLALQTRRPARRRTMYSSPVGCARLAASSSIRIRDSSSR